MVETALQRFNPETGKPNPVSTKEYLLMDRYAQREYVQALTKEEKFNFQACVIKELVAMPQEKRREIQKELVAKLEKRKNTSIADKIEFVQAKLYLKSIALPKKEPIFLRKLRKKVPFKSVREAKSPYLIAS